MNNKLLSRLGFRMKITMQDSRSFVGVIKAFDKHVNVILSECEEFRHVRGKKGKEEREEKRTLGLVLLRGETILAITVEGPPPSDDGPRVSLGGGPGQGRPAGRGMGGTGGGMQGPPRGVGGPPGGMMQPAARAPPQMNMAAGGGGGGGGGYGGGGGNMMGGGGPPGGGGGGICAELTFPPCTERQARFNVVYM